MASCSYYESMSGNDTLQTQNIVAKRKISSQDIRRISDAIHNLSGDANNKPDEEIFAPSEDKACVICGINNAELYRCSSCNNYVCDNCCTHTPDGILCDKCY